ncbi:SEN15 family protein [Pleurotus pulmonarius]
MKEFSSQWNNQYQQVSTFSTKYPRTMGTLFLAYNDLVYSQRWTDVEILDLKSCSRAAIRGCRRLNANNTHNTQIANVVPCTLSELISLEWLGNAFISLGDPPEVYLAITSDDSSIVYYKISRGIVKPPL